MDFDPLPQQRLAIETPLGPTLVVAGPGAGKTFCLIRRVHRLIAFLNYDPARICAVTFTNKAAEEIGVRLKRTLGERAEEVTRGTLHALCLAILREHADAAGLHRGFGVADEEYQRIVLGRPGAWRGRRGGLLTLFTRRRLQDYRLTAGDESVYREYAAYLARRNMLDFDDLIARTATLFRERGDVADAVAARWDYLLVDEFQDLNPAQYEILKRLAAPHRNFFAVGDDEQSIFSWTGADPRVLGRFREDFGIAQPVVLDRNCRCSHQIFETARRVLAENPHLFQATRGRAGVRARGTRLRLPGRRRRSRVAARRPPGRPGDHRAQVGGLRHRLSQAPRGRASRKSVVASRDPLSARPGALPHGRRRGGLRDRCAAGHAGSGGPGGPGGTRAGRLFGAPAPRSAGGGSGGGRRRRPPRRRAQPRARPSCERPRHEEALALRLSGGEPRRARARASLAPGARGGAPVPDHRPLPERSGRATRRGHRPRRRARGRAAGGGPGTGDRRRAVDPDPTAARPRDRPARHARRRRHAARAVPARTRGRRRSEERRVG